MAKVTDKVRIRVNDLVVTFLMIMDNTITLKTKKLFLVVDMDVLSL